MFLYPLSTVQHGQRIIRLLRDHLWSHQLLGRYKNRAGDGKRPDSHYPPTFWPLKNHWKVLNYWHVFIPLWQLYCLCLPDNSLSWRTLSSDSRPRNVPIHNAFPIDSTHATLLQNYPLPSSCLDNLKHQFKWHQMKTWQYQFPPYTSLVSISSSRQTPSPLVKLNDNSHEPHSDIWTEHSQQPFNPSTIQSPSFSQLFNGELGTRVTLPMSEIAMK